MKNTLILFSIFALAGAVGCSSSPPHRTGAAGSTGSAGTTGAAGDTGVAGTTGAAGDTGTAGTTGGAGDTGAAGMTGVAGTTGGGGDTGTAGTGAAGTGAAGSTDTGGTTGTAGTTGGAGAGGDTGAAGATAMACMNSTVVTAGGAEANCPAKTGWKASGMPAAAKGLFNIPDNQLLPQYAIDGSTTTRFTSGMTMADGFYFQVDLGAAKKISGIVVTTTLNATDNTYDVANGYEVGLSTDGTTFTKVAGCTTSAAPIETINFTATMARYVRYTAKGGPIPPTNSPTAWLSIHEFNVLCNN